MYQIEGTLSHGELAILSRRTEDLNRSLRMSVYKSLTRSVLKRSMHRDISEFDDNPGPYIKSTTNLRDFLNKLCGSFFHELARRFGMRLSGRDPCGAFLKNVLLCLVIDRIPLSRFMHEREDVANLLRSLASEDIWRCLEPKARKAQEFVKGTQGLEKGLESLMPSLSTGTTFSQLVHAVLRTIQTVVSAVGTHDEAMITGALTWVILRSNREILFQWHMYVRCLLPRAEKSLVDLVGGDDVEAWKFFRAAFDPIMKRKSSS
jgi:hypothetical protein